MTAQTLKTMTGLTYSFEDAIGENGEVIYSVKRVVQEGSVPVGSFVIHPDYHAEPEVPALVNVQFGAGSPEDRHQRTDVPALGSASLPFVVGHKLVNPLDLSAVAESPIFILPGLAGAQSATGTSAENATRGAVLRTSELVAALVSHWMQRSDLEELTAKYAAFIKSTPWTEQYAKVKAAKIDELTCQILSISERIDELTKQRDELPESAVNSPDVTPDMAPAVQLTGSIHALMLKRGEMSEALAALKNA